MAGAELSHYVFPSFRRRGLATRAVQIVCAYAFGELRLEWVEAHVAPDNTGSLGVARAAAFHATGERVVEDGRELLVLRRQKPDVPFGVPLPVGPS